jgi:hypothetical protein
MSRASLERAGATAVLLALMTWNVSIPYVMVTRLQMGDFRIFYLSARAQIEERHVSPALRTPDLRRRTLRNTLVNLNSPHFQLVLVPLGLVPPGVALSLWAAASLLCLGGSLYVIARELNVVPTWPTCCRAAIWMLAFAGIGAVVGTGELSFVRTLAVTLAWAAARQGLWAQSGRLGCPTQEPWHPARSREIGLTDLQPDEAAPRLAARLPGPPWPDSSTAVRISPQCLRSRELPLPGFRSTGWTVLPVSVHEISTHGFAAVSALPVPSAVDHEH